ncbi:glyoxal oxidase N-terminus-domain-containing protein [Mucidula mucida]|nr:glyoxal oxidase N-terminus-domain-containing protein [Mucidula mucida]
MYQSPLLLVISLYASLVIGRTATEHRRAVVPGQWSLVQNGTTGVSGLQVAVTSEKTVIVLDKVEHSPLTVDGHIAWVSEVNLDTKEVRALNPASNTWCATGSFLSNGTLVSSGGNPVVITGSDGLQALRLFTPCNDGTCDIFENQDVIRLTSKRWYPASVRIEDGSVLIFGGSIIGGFVNSETISNPTYEFFPSKNINGFNGVQIPSQFLHDSLNANHFPIMVYLPDGTIFVAANQNAMIFNWKTNTETRLPNIPNGVRITSPFSAGATLLPLTPENGYTPEILICGGSQLSDSDGGSVIDSQSPTSDQCSRLVLDAAGIAEGWKVETMPQARTMLELILLPDGRVVIVNGAQTGVAGYGFGRNQIGSSDADHPALTPVVYDPAAPLGQRFSSDGIPTSEIPRMYHSTATLIPDGGILLAGSNPNADVSTVRFQTEYRMEFLSPPYMSLPRPCYAGLPETVDFGHVFELSVSLPSTASNVSVSLMDLGFATHGIHMDQRMLTLVSSLSSDKKLLTVTGPPTPALFPPGPAYLFVVTDDGVPSSGHKTLVGTGAAPPSDANATANMMKVSAQSGVDWPSPPTQGEGGDVATAMIPVEST